MAIKLSDKPNTHAIDGTYPYGDIKDNAGSADGTPVNRLVYADLHQFFEKLMDEAGVSHNGLPDNEANGFQLYLALLGNLAKRVDISGSITVSGALSTSTLEAWEYYDGTIAIALSGTFSSTITDGTTILSGLPEMVLPLHTIVTVYVYKSAASAVEQALINNYDNVLEAYGNIEALVGAGGSNLNLVISFKKA
jgi:hypothetical protein